MADPTDQPLVRVPARPLCRTHYEALIPEDHPSGVTWQARYTVAMVKFVQLALEDPRVQKQTEGLVERATAILAQCTPLCCFLGEAACQAVAAEIAEKVGIIVAKRGEGPHGA